MEEGWILVSDKLPKPGERVLVSVGEDFVCEAYIDKSRNWRRFGVRVDEIFNDKVTAWRHFPKTIKEHEEYNKKEHRTTLCWSCKNSVPNNETGAGCSWSKELKPVAGWLAFPTKVRKGKNGDFMDSFFVIQCPFYDHEEN